VTGFVTVSQSTPGGFVQAACRQAKVVLQRPQVSGGMQVPLIQICPEGQRSQESSGVYVTGFVTVSQSTPGGFVQAACRQAN